MGYPHRDRELEGTLKLHEFMREAQDLQGWLASQKQVAGRGESLGEDYEDILVRRGWGQGPAGLCVEGAYESWLRTGLLSSGGRRCSYPAPHRPDVSGGLAPQAACCLASWGHPVTSSPLSSASLHQVCQVSAHNRDRWPAGGKLPAAGREAAGTRAQSSPQGPSDAAGPAVSAGQTQGMGLGKGAGQTGPGGLREGVCTQGHTGSVCPDGKALLSGMPSLPRVAVPWVMWAVKGSKEGCAGQRALPRPAGALFQTPDSQDLEGLWGLPGSPRAGLNPPPTCEI